MDETEQFFVSESIRHSRSLPFRDSIKFLKGLESSLGADHPARRNLRSIVVALTAGDAQLELIELGQLKLKLK